MDLYIMLERNEMAEIGSGSRSLQTCSHLPQEPGAKKPLSAIHTWHSV